MFVQNVSKEAVGVRESLRACTLPHTDHPVLLRVQDTTLELNVRVNIQTGHQKPLNP